MLHHPTMNTTNPVLHAQGCQNDRNNIGRTNSRKKLLKKDSENKEEKIDTYFYLRYFYLIFKYYIDALTFYTVLFSDF